MKQKEEDGFRKHVGGLEEREEVRERKRGKATGGWKIGNKKSMKERMVGYKNEGFVCQEQ